MKEKAVEQKSGYAEIGEAKLYYEIAGEGPPIVLIHAGVADSRQWDEEFAHFAQSYRVLRYDQRGYGRSEPVDGEFSHMGDLVALLDHLDLYESLVLVGCSMGGGLAIDVALSYPDRVKALLLLGAGPSGLTLDLPDHPQAAEAVEAYQEGDLERLAELEAQIWFDGMGRSAQAVNQPMRELALAMNRLALAHEVKGVGTRLPNTASPSAERLDELTIPILVIIGEHDLPYQQAAAEYIAEKAPFARKVVLPDAAHLANMEHPALFQSIVRDFLDELFPFDPIKG